MQASQTLVSASSCSKDAPTLLAQVWLALLDGGHDHVTAGSSRQPVEAGAPAGDCDDVEVFGPRVVGAIHHGAHGEPQRHTELVASGSSLPFRRHLGLQGQVQTALNPARQSLYTLQPPAPMACMPLSPARGGRGPSSRPEKDETSSLQSRQCIDCRAARVITVGDSGSALIRIPSLGQRAQQQRRPFDIRASVTQERSASQLAMRRAGGLLRHLVSQPAAACGAGAVETSRLLPLLTKDASPMTSAGFTHLISCADFSGRQPSGFRSFSSGPVDLDGNEGGLEAAAAQSDTGLDPQLIADAVGAAELDAVAAACETAWLPTRGLMTTLSSVHETLDVGW